MKMKRKQNMNITKKKIMNLLSARNTIKMNGKRTKMNVLVTVETKMNVKKNTNMKMKMNAMLQMER
jgi:hypothetical protein